MIPAGVPLPGGGSMFRHEDERGKTMGIFSKKLPWNVEYNIKRHMKKTGCSAAHGSYSSFTGRAECKCGQYLPR